MERLQGNGFTGENQSRLLELRDTFIPHAWKIVQMTDGVIKDQPEMQQPHSYEPRLISGRTPYLPYSIQGQEALPIQ